MKPVWEVGARSESGWGTIGFVSVGVHVLVIAIATHSWLLWVKRMAPSGTARGTQRLLLYAPRSVSGAAAMSTSTPAKARLVPTRTHQAVFRPRTAPGSASDASEPKQDEPAVNDALGMGSTNIAWVQGFPAGRPDLSKVVKGSSVDVVVDVQIDDTGRVARARAKKGMGQGIDEVVVATVEQWLFYPAIKHGRHVASEQELHFHYERGSGAEPCGWDCSSWRVVRASPGF